MSEVGVSREKASPILERLEADGEVIVAQGPQESLQKLGQVLMLIHRYELDFIGWSDLSMLYAAQDRLCLLTGQVKAIPQTAITRLCRSANPPCVIRPCV